MAVPSSLVLDLQVIQPLKQESVLQLHHAEGDQFMQAADLIAAVCI